MSVPILPAEKVKQDVLNTLRMLRSFKNDLPDGQWEDGPEEIWDDIREYKEINGVTPPADDECWLGYREDLARNMTYWI